MSQYNANLCIATTWKPQAIFDMLTQQCPFLPLDISHKKFGLGRMTADEAMFVKVSDLTLPEVAQSVYLWRRHEIKSTVRVTLWLDKGEARKPTCQSGRKAFIQTLNECVHRLDGDFYLDVMDAIPGGIAMWRHGDRIEVDPRRGSWWQAEHLRMFTFEYTQAHLPES